jgi:hypothetical protein
MGKDLWSGGFRVPATQNGYDYVKGNPVNEVDASGICSFQDSECRRFVNDVRFIIDTGKSCQRQLEMPINDN